MNKKSNLLLRAGMAASLGLLVIPMVSAEKVEAGNSAKFKKHKGALATILGVPAPETTIETHNNGLTSAVVGLSAMKMLVVRQNSDGSLSYGHASTTEEAKAFTESTHRHGPAEE